MFLIDKYPINDLPSIKYNKDIYKNILKLNNLYTWNLSNKEKDFNNLPNILIYSEPSNGKKSLVKLLLKRIYGKNIKKIDTPYIIKGYGSNNIEVKIKQSLYHVEIYPTGKGLDKYMIQEVIDKYANNIIINLKNDRTFKVIWIHNTDKLSYYAQTALRCSMEKYAHTCKFILTGNESSKIIKPLQSRCLIIKLPKPSNNEIMNVLMDISFKENHFLKLKEYNKIINNCNNNIKKAIWLLNSSYHNIDFVDNWKIYLKKVIVNMKEMITKFKTSNITNIRDTLYKIFITNIKETKILKELSKLILKEFKKYNLNYEIINICTKYENSLSQGKRSIIHLEACIYDITNLLYKTKIKRNAS